MLSINHCENSIATTITITGKQNKKLDSHVNVDMQRGQRDCQHVYKSYW